MNRIVILIIGSIIFFVALCIILFSPKYIILDDNHALIKRNNEWLEFNDLSKINGKKIYYLDNNSLNSGEIKYSNNEWLIKKEKSKDYEKVNFDLATTEKIDNISFNVKSVNEDNDSFVREKIKEYNTEIKKLFNSTRIDVDLNNDGVNEKIYSITNFDPEQTSYAPYSNISLVIGNKTKTINESGTIGYSFKSLLDLDNDDIPALIIKKEKKDNNKSSVCYQIYNFDDDDFELIQDCKL